MSAYKAPVADMSFVLRHVVGAGESAREAGLEGDDIDMILENAGALAAEVLAPLNHSGDRTGSRLENGAVITPKGFKEAYNQYRDGGWNGVPFNPDHGGQGLPWALAFAIQEMWQGANLSFGLCPLLNQGAVEAIEQHGTDYLKQTYLEKLVSGQWTGTMNLTEPDAGSDLAAVKTKAEPDGKGTYKISGQKIFITYGEHDLADNILHLVLARLPDAPEGTKGISLFAVPKFIPDDNGNPGARNDVQCVSIEHKTGIHASPTCTMQYGDAGGATGWLVGKENDGLKCMFTMMNNARLSVGLQGVAIAERAYQQALDYARDRVQGMRIGDRSGARVAIIEHPDVRRMLLSMKAQTEAARALAYDAAAAVDRARRGDAAAQMKVDLLTPVVKAWCTDIAQSVTSLGVQVHGGMGFIEETGAAQHFRDARILPIYEGTNGIQAMDLSFRKIVMDGGKAFDAWFAEARSVPDGFSGRLGEALSGLREATDWILKANDMEAVAAVNVPYLNLFGLCAGGVMMARSVQAAESCGNDVFAKTKAMTAEFYAAHILPAYKGCLDTVTGGSGSVKDFTAAMF